MYTYLKDGVNLSDLSFDVDDRSINIFIKSYLNNKEIDIIKNFVKGMFVKPIIDDYYRIDVYTDKDTNEHYLRLSFFFDK